jgi:hypothetical protein
VSIFILEATRADLPQILELYRQLNPSNGDFSIEAFEMRF